MKQYRKELFGLFVQTVVCGMRNALMPLMKDAEPELSDEKKRKAFCRKVGRAMVRQGWTANPMVQTALEYASVPDAEMKQGEESDWELDFKMNVYACLCERRAWKMSDWIDTGRLSDLLEADAFGEAARQFRKNVLEGQDFC